MPTVPHALRVFRESFAAMLSAAEALRTAVEGTAGEIQADPTVAVIQVIVAEQFGITTERMLRRDRHANVALARQTAMAFAREFTVLPLVQIGQNFGGHDHGTVMWACRAVVSRASVDRAFADSVLRLRKKIQTALVSRTIAYGR